MISIHWHKRAVAQLYQVEDYILRDFGEKVRKEFMKDVEKAVIRLTEQPEMGYINPLFSHRKKAYRSIIVRRLNKIVYYIDNNTLHIAAFWDTRKEPKRQARKTP